MDRFAQIKQLIEECEGRGMVTGAEYWLVQEVERLRKIEDAAIECGKAFSQCGNGVLSNLVLAVHHNPRPTDR